MIKASLGHGVKEARKILCLGAHCDDIEIGCGGTILRWARENPELHFDWVVFSSTPDRATEAKNSLSAFLPNSHNQLIIKSFRNGFFPYLGNQIKDYFEELKEKINPDIIFTHYRDDLHQDHRVVSELTWNTFRNHLILEYEIPKYDGDLGSPNLFVDLDEGICQQKVDLILENYATQREKQWFTESTFWGLMRLRGIESNSKFAEGYYSRKLVL